MIVYKVVTTVTGNADEIFHTGLPSIKKKEKEKRNSPKRKGEISYMMSYEQMTWMNMEYHDHG